MREWWSHPRVADLAVYLIPQALPLSIPVGLTFGILWALGRLSASRTALVLVLVLALGASLVSFVTLAWVMPNANQAFRTATAGGPVAKGNNELTIGELRERIDDPSPLSPAFAFGSFKLGAELSRTMGSGGDPIRVGDVRDDCRDRAQVGPRRCPSCSALLLIIGFYACMDASRDLALDRTLSPFAAAWAPNAVMLMLSAAVMSLRVQRRNPAR